MTTKKTPKKTTTTKSATKKAPAAKATKAASTVVTESTATATIAAAPAAPVAEAKTPVATVTVETTPVATKTEPAKASVPAATQEQKPQLTVAMLQQRLHELGYYHGWWDGQYGPLTAQAVGHFQYRHGLQPNGEPNTATLAKLGF